MDVRYKRNGYFQRLFFWNFYSIITKNEMSAPAPGRQPTKSSHAVSPLLSLHCTG